MLVMYRCAWLIDQGGRSVIHGGLYGAGWFYCAVQRTCNFPEDAAFLCRRAGPGRAGPGQCSLVERSLVEGSLVERSLVEVLKSPSGGETPIMLAGLLDVS